MTLLAGFGYSYPIGSAERGTDTRDVSFGLVPLSLAVRYDLSLLWNASIRGGYAPNIPTLCASGPDCWSSIGRDVWITAGIGRRLPGWWRFRPQIGLEVGWEWFTAELSDSGVGSSRSWNGPFALLEVFSNLKSEGPWSFGPTVAIGAGLFTHFDLETPAWRSSGATDATIHAWPLIGFRVGRRL
jgi:hypothetical protein